MPWDIAVEPVAGIAAATLILWAMQRWWRHRQRRRQLLRRIHTLRAEAEARIARMQVLSARAQSLSMDDET